MRRCQTACIARSTSRSAGSASCAVSARGKERIRVRWTGPVMAGGKLYLVSTLGLLAQSDPANGSIVTEKDTGHADHCPVVTSSF